MSHRSRLILAAKLLVGLGIFRLAFRYLLGFPLWGDEAFLSINFLVRDWRGLWRGLEYGQIAPPIFLWVQWIAVQCLGGSEWVLRLFPFLSGVATLILFSKACGRLTNRRAALLATAFLSTAFYPMRHAVEAKPYAVELLVSLVFSILGWRVWIEPESDRRRLLLLADLPIGIWASYTAVFPAASVGLLLVWDTARAPSRRRIFFLAAYSIVLLTSWVALIKLFAAAQTLEAGWLGDLTTWRAAFPPWDQLELVPVWLLTVHAGNALAYPYGGNNFGSTATLLLVVAGAVDLWRRPRYRPLLLLLLGPIPVALVAAALHRYPYGTSARTMLYLAPAVCFLAGVGTASIIRRVECWWPVVNLKPRRLTPFALAGAMALIPLIGLTIDLAMPWKGRDEVVIRRMVNELAAASRPGDRWILFNGATPPPRLRDLMIRDWMQQVAEIRYYVQWLAPVPVYWAPDPDVSWPEISGRTWFIVHKHDYEGYPADRPPLYRERFARLWGKPTRKVYSLGVGTETVEVECYESATLAALARRRAGVSD